MPKPVKGKNLEKTFQVRGDTEDIRKIREIVAGIKEILPQMRKYPELDLPYAVTSDVILFALKDYRKHLEVTLQEKER